MQICENTVMPVITILPVFSLLNSVGMVEIFLKTSSYFNVEFFIIQNNGECTYLCFWLFRVEGIQTQDTEHLFLAD